MVRVMGGLKQLCRYCHETTERTSDRTGWPAQYAVLALGSNAHIFARPRRREELAHCFETVLGNPVRTVEFPSIDQPMLVVSSPGGRHLRSGTRAAVLLHDSRRPGFHNRPSELNAADEGVLGCHVFCCPLWWPVRRHALPAS